MSESPLARKLKIKPGHRIALVNAPEGYLQKLRPLPANLDVADRLEGTFDWIQVFVRNQAELELERIVPKAGRALKPDSLLWISFRKAHQGPDGGGARRGLGSRQGPRPEMG